MSGTPSQKKEPDPTLSARVESSLFRSFHDTVKRMRRKPTDALEELVRAFVEYTADGRTPNFPLIVSAESYRAPSGEIMIDGPRKDSGDPRAQLNRIEAYAKEIMRLSGAEVVKMVEGALEGGGSHSQSPVSPPAFGPESKPVAPGSRDGGSPRQDGRSKPGGKDGQRGT